ncbi:hypothetical protein FVR03_07530 [Pontibacter qinzhouensis]|uniref:Uncharacterized protein n=1 Tax=Pontibacter qinzhouensis TaxID=2603253 RepID=A0A5C8KC83_9BACT|nr:hypothetical protein [Pontibacter qinzhouensis]TXK48705.1 hypothetical protein FVR03_07530 [Pontibacter qinzhouensis]
MKHLIKIFLLILSVGCNSLNQKETVTTGKNKFRLPSQNQGEREDYWAQEFFKKEYKKQSHKIYTAEVIKIGENTLAYDDKTFDIYGVNDTLKLIFESGIIYPQLISGYSKEPRKSQQELNLLSVSERYFYEVSRGDNATITNLEELLFLSSTPKVKRFRFWLSLPKSANPNVYLFELTNNNATKQTDLITFIQNAKLTFLKEGWLII